MTKAEITAAVHGMPRKDQLTLIGEVLERSYGLDTEDVIELLDPCAQEDVRISREQARKGMTRPASELLAELEAADEADTNAGA